MSDLDDHLDACPSLTAVRDAKGFVTGFTISTKDARTMLERQQRRMIREIKKPSGYVTVTAFRFDLLDRLKAMKEGR